MFTLNLFLAILVMLALVVYYLRSSRAFMAYAITNMAAACSK